MSISTTKISETEWSGFLSTMSRQHHGWLTQLETHDHVTGETVTSPEMPLQSVELDLEDQNHPRINVNVQCVNSNWQQKSLMNSVLSVMPD